MEGRKLALVLLLVVFLEQPLLLNAEAKPLFWRKQSKCRNPSGNWYNNLRGRIHFNCPRGKHAIKLTVIFMSPCAARIVIPFDPVSSYLTLRHFRTTSSLFLKASLGAHAFICKYNFIHMATSLICVWIRIYFHTKALGLSLKKEAWGNAEKVLKYFFQIISYCPPSTKVA